VTTLQLTGISSAVVTASQDAVDARDSALADASLITRVTSPASLASAVETQRDLKRIAKSAEDSRVAIKAPVLEITRKIDAAAAEFSEPLKAEIARINTLLTGYQVEQERIAREEAQKRDAELARQRAEEAKRAAEAARLEREAREKQEAAERAAREATNAEARAAAEKARKAAEAERAELARKAEAEALAAAQEQARTLAAMPVAAPKPAGMSASAPWTFEVTDLAALQKAEPNLVEVTVRKSSVLARIREGVREIPGLRIFQETRVTVRA